MRCIAPQSLPTLHFFTRFDFTGNAILMFEAVVPSATRAGVLVSIVCSTKAAVHPARGDEFRGYRDCLLHISVTPNDSVESRLSAIASHRWLVAPVLFESLHWSIDLVTDRVEMFDISTEDVGPVVFEQLCSLANLLLLIQVVLFPLLL